MTEKLLQYIWNYKIFGNTNFEDTEGNCLEILNFGTWNHNSGPDFLDAKIKINDLIFCGPIEIHVKASDWKLHNHRNDPFFENIILHVVYEEDTILEELYTKNTPTLVLKNYVSAEIVTKYTDLHHDQFFIPCETLLKPSHIPFQFSEELVLKKLDGKAQQIEIDLERCKNNLEEVFFHYLAYSFGLKVNATQFKNWAENIPFNILQKIRHSSHQLEALFLGKAGLLAEPVDEQSLLWKNEYDYLKTKFQLQDEIYRPQFSKLRPDNFPTIRLSQLAQVYHHIPNLFSKLIHALTYDDLCSHFNSITASSYWDTHFTLSKISEKQYSKKLSSTFIDRILLNTVLPFQYFYFRNHDEEKIDGLLEIFKNIKAEDNNLIKAWKNLRIPIGSALDSQAFIHQYKTFCSHKKCLSCSIGLHLLKS